MRQYLRTCNCFLNDKFDAFDCCIERTKGTNKSCEPVDFFPSVYCADTNWYEFDGFYGKQFPVMNNGKLKKETVYVSFRVADIIKDRMQDKATFDLDKFVVKQGWLELKEIGEEVLEGV